MPLYKVGGTWYCRFQIKGKIYRRSTRTGSRRKAEEFERRYRGEIEGGGGSSGRTYEQALIKWAQGEMPDSCRSAANNTRELCHHPLEHVVQPAHAMRDRMLSEGYSPITINRRLAVVRRILNLAYRRWDWLNQPLGQKIQLLSEKGTARHIYLSKEQVAELAGHMSGAPRSIMLLAAYTGLRRGELLDLRPEQWHPPYITLDARTKSGRPRTAVVIDEMHELVQLPWGVTDHDLRKQWERARLLSGLEHVRFHDLRHTFASWLAADSSIPLTVIRDVLGHSSLAVTSRYSHLRTDALDAVKDALKLSEI